MLRTPTILPLTMLLAACASDAPAGPGGAGDGAGDDTTVPASDDTGAPSGDDSGAPAVDDTGQPSTTCAARTMAIPDVVASSADLDACCGGSFEALTDGSGLTDDDGRTLHDCASETSFKSANGQFSGNLDFDLGGVWRVDAFTIWNSGQVGGERGIAEVTLWSSMDGETYTPVPGGAVTVAPPRCPAGPQVFPVHGTDARHLRLQVIDTWEDGGVTNFGIGGIAFTGSQGCDLTEVTDITVTSPHMEACCGGSFDLLVDGSGLDVDAPDGLHSCSDDGTWKSATNSRYSTRGALELDLGDVVPVAELAIWNSGQLDGDRGVAGMVISTSVDGDTYTAVEVLPARLRAADTCPAEAQFLMIEPVTEARYVRVDIEGNHGDSTPNVGLGEIKVYAETP